MKIFLRKTFLKDIQKVSEPQKSQVKSFLEELHASPSISESSHNIKKLKHYCPVITQINSIGYRYKYPDLCKRNS